ncbi:hypothetical protein [Mucilaginibacter gotjawali]|uniref:Uncharacterized protein n=1 Tax=Mucilaginibacter gotjawali TaxID=1550579 RepID=A0A839SLY3_9SPHI|nr:hypothetical protein [Mucilaginibacter gotjawali]MBB3058254.1 hypothetical protein [Mucilaginibacter gotjawali]
MNEIKTLADQLRSRMAKPDTPEKPAAAPKKKATKPHTIPAIIDQLRAYDITGHKTLVHGRFDVQTAQLLHHLKMATGIEVTRVLCYAVKQLLEKHPEIKTVIKEHLDKFEL